MFSSTDIQRIVDIIQHHYSFMIFTSLGTEVLSDEDKLFLTNYGIDIEKLEERYPPYMRNFLLGRLTAVLEEKQAKELTNEDFEKYLDRGQFIPLSERERAEYKISREITYNHLKGLANKVVGATKDIMLEENKKNIISETISEGIKNRKSIASVVSDLGHRTGEWDRDWKRIVVTEMQNIYNQGIASEIMRKYTFNSYVYKDVFPGACRHCIKLYLTNGVGSEPRVFKLSELIANGSNVGRKVDEWKPTIDSTHPFCRCNLRVWFLGQVWDKIKQAWEYTGERIRKVIRHSKIKITVGDKEFYV